MQFFRRASVPIFASLAIIAFTFGTPNALETSATPLQALYMIKQLVPTVKTVGVMMKQSESDNSNLMDQVNRASAALSVKIVVADVEGLPDVAAQFRDLTGQYHIQALWIPAGNNVLNDGVAKGYLIKNSTLAGIPLFAPGTDWVSSGACAAVVTDGGNTKLYVNQKTLGALGIKVPEKYASVTQVLANN